MLIGYGSLIDIYRQGKRFDALLAIMGESVEKTGVLETLGTEVQAVSGDAETMRRIVATPRDKVKTEPSKFGCGRRLATALLALEAKQYETAGEFFKLALAAKPKHSDEVFMVWGVGLLSGSRAAEAAKVFKRGIDQRALPDGNPVLPFLPGRGAGAGRSLRRGPGRRADRRREERFHPHEGPPGLGAVSSPNATTRL